MKATVRSVATALSFLALSGVAYAASSKADVAEYTAEIKAPADKCKAGSECTVSVEVTAKGEYHINKDYPQKVKTAKTDGVTYTKETLTKDDGKLEEKKISFPLKFTAAKAGKTTLNVSLRLAVCAESNCITASPDLSLDVDVQ
jgi:hypothetical protein